MSGRVSPPGRPAVSPMAPSSSSLVTSPTTVSVAFSARYWAAPNQLASRRVMRARLSAVPPT